MQEEKLWIVAVIEDIYTGESITCPGAYAPSGYVQVHVGEPFRITQKVAKAGYSVVYLELDPEDFHPSEWRLLRHCETGEWTRYRLVQTVLDGRKFRAVRKPSIPTVPGKISS
jgi:hypothetical protein